MSKHDIDNYLAVNLMSATSGEGTVNPSGAPEITPIVLGFVLLDLSFVCIFRRSLFVFLYLFLAIVLSVLLRFTDSDYPIGIQTLLTNWGSVVVGRG